jgi:two-component system, chemotaxis family, sensor kinase CheA
MAASDEEFMNRLRATFKVEAEEHLQAISSTLLDLEKSASPMSQTSAVEGVYREAHSLKGAARAVDFSDIEAICQAIEGVFASWKRELSTPSPESLDALHRALDMIHALLESADQGPNRSESKPRDELIKRLSRFEFSPPTSTRTEKVESTASAPAPPTPPLVALAAVPSQTATNPPVDSEKSAVSQTVRIPISKLDSRLLQAEDMLAVKSMTAQRAAELREISGRFDRWQREWAKVSVEARVLRQTLEHQAGTAALRPVFAAAGTVTNFLDWNFDYIRSLENKLLSLTSQAEQDRHSVGKRVDDLLEDSKKLLMLPFSHLASIFPKVIRDLCRDQGKEAELVVQGGDVEIDKRILEEIKDALIHILRNCVDHGIEPPAERERLNKPPRAVITIAVSAVSGSQVEILVSDDGAGVDVQRVKDSAVRHGIISPAEARTAGDADALDLVFHSEVSTSPAVTAISGRGLGMAIVRAQTEKLGGRVLIESRPQVGTSLRIVLPLTLATFRGVVIAVADRTFVVPTANVVRVLRVKSKDIQTVENRQVISLQGRAVSLAQLDRLLGLPINPAGADDSAMLYAVLLHSAEQRIAFVVDQVVREEEVLVKPLRKPLVRVRNIAGVTVLSSGKTVPILNVSDLMQSARTHSGVASAGESASKRQQAPIKKVLVAEDSITSRMLLKGILEGAGFLVRTAVDGMDAYTALHEDRFDLVVSDVEMPRMDGFDLTRRIRADGRMSEMPVVLVSALESRAERERGIDAGASAYIIKSSFDQTNLLEAVRRLV